MASIYWSTSLRLRTPIASVSAFPALARAALRIGVVLAVILGVVIIAIWIFQERLVFLPPDVPATQGRHATRVDYRTPAGQPLFGFFVGDSASRAAGDSRRVVVLFHGNGDLADSWIDWAREAHRRTGWDVFLAEYRGYGGLAGTPTAAGVVEDARATIDFVLQRFNIPPARLALYGHSLGTGIAATIGASREVYAVLLESPFTSINDLGRRNFGPLVGWAVPLVSRFDFAPQRDAARINGRVSVSVGELDPIAPPEMARAVFAAARIPGELLVVPGATHGDVALVARDKYWNWLERGLR